MNKLKQIIVALALVFSGGCATSITEQSDQEWTDDGSPAKLVTTTTRVRSFFASKASVNEVLITNGTAQDSQQTAIGSVETESTEELSTLIESVAKGVAAGLSPAP
jgi:hypothetical protein